MSNVPEIFAAFLKACPTACAASAAAAVYYTPPTAFDSHAHLLHGVIHPNGFGHLARVNGREGGSSKLTGQPMQSCAMLIYNQLIRQAVTIHVQVCEGCMSAGKQLMAIWDSLCQLLRARQISVEDVSNKVNISVKRQPVTSACYNLLTAAKFECMCWHGDSSNLTAQLMATPSL